MLIISEDEVRKQLQNGKDGKASEPSDINLELLKYGGEKCIMLITRLMGSSQKMGTEHTSQLLA